MEYTITAIIVSVIEDMKTRQSVTHGQCDGRPTVTFLASEQRRPSTSTKYTA